ncbi:hypothetical protein Tco_1126203 [Tanacetum coccineum]
MAEIPTSVEVFALVMMESNQDEFQVSLQVILILEEFADVVPKELPSGLPLMRDDKYGYVKYCKKSVKKRTRERMSDQEAKEIKAEAREIMPQPSTVNCS